MNTKRPSHSLISQCAAGDLNAFDQLYLSQKKLIVFIIRNKTHCPEDIEDISQNVAMRIFLGIGSLRSPEAFSVWLHTIIRRECERYYSRKAIPTVEYEESPDIEDRLCEADSDCLPGPYAELHEQYIQIHTALEFLPAKIRHILELHYGYGLHYKQIAENLGITTDDVLLKIYRARKQVCRKLAKREN